MTREQVKKEVIESLREMLVDDPDPDISEKTNPIIKFGLDSLAGVDYACTLSLKLKYTIPFKINPFVNDDLNQPRTIGEIVDLVCELLETQKK